MKFLELDHIVRINDRIYQDSLANKEIEYSGKDEYCTDFKKIKELIERVPPGTLVDVATYYLKNIILLQAFPNANHRTALLSVELFLEMNRKGLKYSLDESIEFHRNSFNIQTKVYKTLEARGTTILTEKRNEFYDYCKRFIETHLTKGD